MPVDRQKQRFCVVIPAYCEEERIPRFVEAYVRTGIPVLVGNRMAESRRIPPVRRLANYMMTWLLNRHMRWYIPDTQCGFRLYRCDVIPYVAARSRWRAAESEMLLHIAARGIRIDVVPVQVIYASERSRLRPFRDTFRFLVMMWRFGRQRKRPVTRYMAGG